MIRSIAVVIAGYAIWSLLWVAGSQGLGALMPGSFDEDGVTRSAGVLLLYLIWSVVLSVGSGFVTATLAKSRPSAHTLALGIALLATGIPIELSWWSAATAWYHLAFLVLLIPAAAFGGRLATGGRRVAPAV